MKALVIMQPDASDCAAGYSMSEGRSWRTKHRGPILICSNREKVKDAGGKYLPAGMAVAVANLVDITGESGSWLWMFSWVQAIKPFAIKGKLGLFDVNIDEAQLECVGPRHTEEKDKPAKPSTLRGESKPFTW